ncbi:PadR family transcriptional regulator [Natrinema salaciae]|uniref:Transcriptional regulator PadR-like family protein n=1 Tax=Natrinema salaciae TaxID=1186196 RepID=A0A1H9BDK5_9EURY|nr:helix-turn-helix transcriptional regulator [Natrinema salaciae]SEP87082.1 Transcriptional regulator PadR-like family protein [Natrinema salaciae]
MQADNLRDLENPARVDAPPSNQPTEDSGEPTTTRPPSSELRPDGGTDWTDLTAVQRDCLEAVVRLERVDERSHEAEISRELDRTYPDLNHNRLYPTLTVLVGYGLLERRERAADDDRVEYVPTDAGLTLLRQRVERLADTCGLVTLDRSDDTTARGDGDG